jgi:type IV secretion system protein VirB1
MLPGMEMLACPNLAVSPEIMQHVVHVESSTNPYAIGVVGGQLERQPRNLSEALATAQMLDAKGYNFSVGLAQVNRANLERYGLGSYREAFGTCANLSAGARILADCYTSAHGDWPKAFSCYYSGNFTTGFRDGYVQKIYASIDRQTGKPVSPTAAFRAPIGATTPRSLPATPTADAVTASHADLKPVTVYASRGANYRVTLRSMAIDTAAQATVAEIATSISKNASTARKPAATESPNTASAPGTDSGQSSVAAAIPPETTDGSISAERDRTLAAGDPTRDAVFVPKVRGPDDRPDSSASTGPAPATMEAGIASAGTGNDELQQEQRDAAFVF